jgi:hypothetical protein
VSCSALLVRKSCAGGDNDERFEAFCVECVRCCPRAGDFVGCSGAAWLWQVGTADKRKDHSVAEQDDCPASARCTCRDTEGSARCASARASCYAKASTRCAGSCSAGTRCNTEGSARCASARASCYDKASTRCTGRRTAGTRCDTKGSARCTGTRVGCRAKDGHCPKAGNNRSD